MSSALVQIGLAVLVSAVIAHWMLTRPRHARVHGIDLVNQAGVLLGRMSVVGDYGVSLSFGNGEGSARLGISVDKIGQPSITMWDAKGRPRIELGVRLAPEEFPLPENAAKMDPAELSRLFDENPTERGVIQCQGENPEVHIALTNDALYLYGEDPFPFATLSSAEQEGTRYPWLYLKSTDGQASVSLGTLPPGSPRIECRQKGEVVTEFPTVE